MDISAYVLFAIGPLVGNAVLVLLGSIASDFSVNPTQILIAVPAFMIPFALVQLFSGALSDIKGRIPVILFGLVFYGAGLILVSISVTLPFFTSGYALAGFGFGFVNPVIIALITDYSEPSEIQGKMGITGALATTMVGLGPAIAGQMVIYGWRLFYAIFVGIAFFVAVVLRASRPRNTRTTNDNELRELLRAFSEELKRPVVLLMMLSGFLISASYGGITVWTSRGLTGAFPPALVGGVLMLLGVTGLTAGLSISRIVSKFGERAALGLGLFSLFTSIGLLISIGDVTHQANLMFVGLAILILGWAAGSLSPVVLATSQKLSPDRRGALAGLLTFSMFVGNAFVPIIYEPFFGYGMRTLYLAILVASVCLSGALFAFTRTSTKTLMSGD